MGSTILAFLLVGYLPGALLFRVPLGNRPKRAAIPADERAFWAVVLSAVLTVVLALGLAAYGRYTLFNLLLIEAGVSVAIVALFRRRLLFGAAARPGPSALIPAGLLALGLFMFLPPSEYIIGGRDPGVYFNEGIRIAQRGGVTVEDPVVSAVTARTRELFFPWHGIRLYYSIRFMGSVVQDPVKGTVVSQFPQLFPASIAVGYHLDGLNGARRVTVFWALLGLLGVYFLGVRLVGRPVGAVAAVLLAVNVAQVWFARYPASEIMMQGLAMAGLLAFARAHHGGDRFFAPVAGVLLGLPVLFRVEAVLLLAGVGAAVLLGILRRQRPAWSFVAALVATTTASVMYLWRVNAAYIAYPLSLVRDSTTLERTAVALVAAASVGFVVVARRPAVWRRIEPWLPWVIIAIVGSAAVYALFLRIPAGRLAEHDAAALRTYARFYATVPGLAAALLGYALIVRRNLFRDPAFIATVTAFALFFFYRTRIVPEHFWQARRFVPVVLPATMLFASAALLWPLGWKPAAAGARVARLIVAPAALAVLAVIGWQHVGATRAIAGHVEYQGVIARLEALADRFKDDELVIIESRNASDLHVLGMPLAYIYGRNVLVLPTPVPNRTVFAAFLTAARERYRNVYFMGGGGTDMMSPLVAATRVHAERFRVPEYAQPVNAFPREVRQKEFAFEIFRFVDPVDAGGPFTLDVGTEDAMYVLRFHEAERSGDTSFRWTRASSFITVLGIRPGRRRITLWLNDGGRPPHVARAHVVVELDDQRIGEADVTDRFLPYEFEVPGWLADQIVAGDGAARLRLATNTWIPRDALGGGDDRQLGVMVDRVAVR